MAVVCAVCDDELVPGSQAYGVVALVVPEGGEVRLPTEAEDVTVLCGECFDGLVEDEED